MTLRLFAAIFVAAAVSSAHGGSKGIERETTLKILEAEKFRIVHRVADLPRNMLVAAGIIPRRRPVDTVIADPGHDYQRHPASVDFSKAHSQLIFGAISPNYFLFCTREGGFTEAEHVRLISQDGRSAKQILHAIVWPEEGNLSQLRARIRTASWLPLEVHHPSMVYF